MSLTTLSIAASLSIRTHRLRLTWHHGMTVEAVIASSTMAARYVVSALCTETSRPAAYASPLRLNKGFDVPTIAVMI